MVFNVQSYIKCNNAQWYVFILLLSVIFVKSVLLNLMCYSAEPGYIKTLIFSLPQKLVPALLVAGFVFVAKHQWWTIIANVLVDIWIIANLFYFKANGIFLSYEIMTMAGNLDGYWGSLLNYIGWDIVVYPIITIIYSILIWGVESKKRNYWYTCMIVFAALVLTFGDQVIHKVHKTDQGQSSIKTQLRYCLPFAHAISYAQEEWVDYNWWSKQYIRKFSIISYFPSFLIYKCASPKQNVIHIENVDDSKITPFVSDKLEIPNPKFNLIFILVESLESWASDTINGLDFMPNLNRIIHDNHTLYCRNLKSQTVHGNSADGQLIVITGLLPITDGVVCKSFADNAYPSYVQCYKTSSLINPYPGTWNKSKTTRSYHFGELIEPRNGRWNDEELSEEIIHYIDTTQQPFCTMGLTITSHAPFSYGATNPKYIVDGMPAKMSAYLNCIAYVDSCIGAIYSHIRESEHLATNTILVITGDHTVFRSKEKEMDKYAKDMHINFQSTKTHVPLIIWSPLISGSQQINETCYQMDIYPTIMSLIGCEDYYWKGLGANLLEKEAYSNRLVGEQEAYELSNVIIKSNYFRKIISRDE